MTQEQQAEAARVEAEAKAKADAEGADDSSSKIDYEAELKREKEAREKAEQLIAENKFKDNLRKKADEGGGEEKPLTASELHSILASDRQQTQKEVKANRIQELAKGLSTSIAEADLTVEIHRNTTFPQHFTLQEQVEASYAIANRKKLIGTTNEALRALKGKDGVNNNAAGSFHDSRKAGEPEMAGGDKAAILASGFLWNGTSRRYEKKLNNGDILVRDSKTKNTFLIKK